MLPDNSEIVRQRQSTIRNQLEACGMSLKAIALDSGLPYSTLLSYFPLPGGDKPVAIPMSAVFALCGVIPDELLSLLLPDGRQIVQAPESIDHDTLADHLRDWLREKDHAHHPDSPAGREISDCEDARLRAKLSVVRAA